MTETFSLKIILLLQIIICGDRRLALSDTVRHQADSIMTAYCGRRVPLEVRDQIRLHHEFRGDTVTLFEDRPGWKNPETWTHQPIAQFRFNSDDGQWTLYCADRNSRWHLYDLVQPTSNLEKLLKAVDEDQTGIFYG
ncbi:MAG: DUF3024 domain-containing protein [Bacteroidota bacterium]